MKCIECGKEFDSKRNSGRYCSCKCKGRYSRRAKSVTLSPKSVTLTHESVTLTPESDTICNANSDKIVDSGECSEKTLSSEDTLTPSEQGMEDMGFKRVVLDKLTDSSIVSCKIEEPASLEDYLDPDGRKYATRTNPEKLNWGEPMSYAELLKAGLVANRVTIPGDFDYARV